MLLFCSPLRRVWLTVAIAASVAGLIAVDGASASGVACQTWAPQPPDRGSSSNALNGVAATSTCNAWAVGYSVSSFATQTLVERWNGRGWRIQPSPNVGGSGASDSLAAVAATSPGNAWAVGVSSPGFTAQTLIEHWDGHLWSAQTSRNPGGPTNDNQLRGVAATSSSNAWAVGYDLKGTGPALIEHWNGKAWHVQASSGPGSDNSLTGVAAISAFNAWAAGSYYNGSVLQNLAMHCC